MTKNWSLSSVFICNLYIVSTIKKKTRSNGIVAFLCDIGPKIIQIIFETTNPI